VLFWVTTIERRNIRISDYSLARGSVFSIERLPNPVADTHINFIYLHPCVHVESQKFGLIISSLQDGLNRGAEKLNSTTKLHVYYIWVSRGGCLSLKVVRLVRHIDCCSRAKRLSDR